MIEGGVGDGDVLPMNCTAAAPWTEEQVQNIRTFQECGYLHPFTCPHHSNQALDVCTTNLYCQVSGCEYRQYWVHNFMADGPLPPNPFETYADAKEFCEGAFGPLGIDCTPYIKIVRNFLELQRNKTIDEVVERLQPWGVGMFTGWKGHTEQTLITLEFAEEEFEASFKDVIESIKEMKRE